MRPFPEPKREPLQPTVTLQAAFDAAMASTPQPPKSVPIAIVAIDPTGPPHPFAGQRLTELHFSASLLKVAAMYAAYELRAAAAALVSELELEADEVMAGLRTSFDPVIDAQRLPQLAGLDKKFLLPRYDEIFDPESSPFDFSQSFRDHLFGAIALGKNEHAAHCIHAIGFGYLTRAMGTAGFLNPSLIGKPAAVAEADSIWLAGDFNFGYPAQRIPCVNDTPVAQATSVRQMARLFTLLVGGELIEDGSSDAAMVKLLEEAFVANFLFLDADPSIHYVTQANKIGEGPVNSGPPPVGSEALIVEFSGRLFVVAFQNLRLFQKPDSVFPVARVVDKTIAAFPPI